MSDLLKELAEKLNISTHYNYFYGGEKKECVASDELLKFMIKDMGYKADSDEDILRSLDRAKKVRWQRALEAVYVRVCDDISFDIVLKKDETDAKIDVLTRGK